VTYTASCTVSASATSPIANTATVAAPAGVTDSNNANDSATDTDTVVGATISGTKTASGTFAPGSTVTYTVVLNNSGPGPQADNPGDEFTDVLPATLTLVSANATSPTAVANVGTNTVTWNGSIAAGGSVTITITATINSGVAPGTTITNQGTISYDSDGNAINDATAQTDNPATQPPSDPTSFVVVSGEQVVPIPALDWRGLLALAVLLAAVGAAWLRRG